jgi:hypothetical protein
VNSDTRTQIINALCMTGMYPIEQYNLMADDQITPYAICRILLKMKQQD